MWKRTTMNKVPAFSFKVRPRAVDRLESNKKLTRSMSIRIYKKYIVSSEWEEKKKQYKKNECEICGYNKMLSLHHITYKNLLFETEKDLVTLCKYCHHAGHIGLISEARLKNPSHSLGRIVNRIRNNKFIKETTFSLFLRRRFISRYGDKELPEMNFFRKFYREHLKAREYPFGYSITKL